MPASTQGDPWPAAPGRPCPSRHLAVLAIAGQAALTTFPDLMHAVQAWM
jgi:hypothetical protein